VEANAQPSRLAGREQINRKFVGRRRSEEYVVAAVLPYDGVLRLLKEWIAALLLAIDRQRHGLRRRNRLSIGWVKYSTDPHHARHWPSRRLLLREKGDGACEPDEYEGRTCP
jgi:hypothetical protein